MFLADESERETEREGELHSRYSSLDVFQTPSKDRNLRLSLLSCAHTADWCIARSFMPGLIVHIMMIVDIL